MFRGGKLPSEGAVLGICLPADGVPVINDVLADNCCLFCPVVPGVMLIVTCPVISSWERLQPWQEEVYFRDH